MRQLTDRGTDQQQHTRSVTSNENGLLYGWGVGAVWTGTCVNLINDVEHLVFDSRVYLLKCETADNVLKGKSYTNRIVYTNSPPLHNQQEREDIIIISCLIITKVTGEKIHMYLP